MDWPAESPPACRDTSDVERAAPVSGYYPLQDARTATGEWIVAELLVWSAGRMWSFPGVEDHALDAELVGSRIGPRVPLPEPAGPLPPSGPVVYVVD